MHGTQYNVAFITRRLRSAGPAAACRRRGNSARTIVVQNAGNGAFAQQDVDGASVIHSVFHIFCEELVNGTTVI
jgi:hypothetical protein